MKRILTNGRKIETLSDYQEKQRRARKVTIGEVEDVVTGVMLAVKEVTDELLARTDGLAAHIGYVPPVKAQAAHVEAVMQAEHGVDRE